jgi:hypothetical protein
MVLLMWGGDTKIKREKGADFDPVTGEIAYVKQSGSTSNSVRNPVAVVDGKMEERTYVPSKDAHWYKARWFRHHPFSYLE